MSSYRKDAQWPVFKDEKSQRFHTFLISPPFSFLPSLPSDSYGHLSSSPSPPPLSLSPSSPPSRPLLLPLAAELCRAFLEEFEASSDDDLLRKKPYIAQLVSGTPLPLLALPPLHPSSLPLFHTPLSPHLPPVPSLSPTPSLSLQQSIVNHETNVLQLHLDDVAASPQSFLIPRIETNTLRYQRLFYKAADRLLRALQPTVHVERDVQDIWQQHRATRFEQARSREQKEAGEGGGAQVGEEDSDDEEEGGRGGQSGGRKKVSFPVELTRRYELHIIPQSGQKVSTMRSVRADDVGSLVTLRGIITRVTDVAPLVQVVTYICTTCGWETYQSINDRTFTPLTDCPSSVCGTERKRGHLTLQTRGSKFVKYQAVKLQELPAEVPVGNIPRSLNVRMYGQLCRTVKPGDEVTLSGIFLPTPYVGYRAIRAGLTADVYIEVTHLTPAKAQYTEIDLTPDLMEEVETRSRDADIYDQLAASIAPEIYGHTDVKKALLLLMVSGVSKEMGDGVKIRGDINVLLMGDPGVAKSQLLKHIAHIAPRGVYTTGKGSSGVGLTAAVLRDQVTGDMSLEGGSLVLADKGVCCIDEFDKMEEGDRTAIHEVMEQQTVSIAKAGITTTLNARTAVVAAANPVYGRWDKRKSQEANLGLPTSLLSRFDLSFIILDRPAMQNDLDLAAHVTHVHRTSEPRPSRYTPLSSAFLRAYIAYSRRYSPYIPRGLQDEIVGHYIGLRQEDDHHLSSSASASNNRQRFVTPRSLLSILRLAQAHARLHLQDVVRAVDIQEAIRLLYVSKRSEEEDEEVEGRAGGGAGVRRDADSEIYMIVKGWRDERRRNDVSKGDVERAVLSRGYTAQQFYACLDRYERLNVWMVQGTKVIFLQGNTAAMDDDEDVDMDD